MKKPSAKAIPAILLAALFAFSSGCTGERDYGTEYNPETDFQYSYDNQNAYQTMVQSDGKGQYLAKNGYIYYYSNETNKLTPLCNKPNCLHDIESDMNRQNDCNAFIGRQNEFIQYYEGNVYCFAEDLVEKEKHSCLYRISRDGSRRDKIFTASEEMNVNVTAWLIHRGRLYYGLESYTNPNSRNVKYNYSLKSVALSSRMSDKDAVAIYETDKNTSASGLGAIKAYQHYICYAVLTRPRDFESTVREEWIRVERVPMYLYDTETGQNREIPVPEGNEEYTAIGAVTFLKDRLLVKMYNESKDNKGKAKYGTYPVPVYSMKYDLTDVKVWKEGVQQGKLLQTYGDYVILSDASLQRMIKIGPYLDPSSPKYLSSIPPFEEMGLTKTNVEIYSADGDRVSYFVYPMNNKGNFNGFGPDGYNAEFKDNGDGSWSVFRLKLDDVLHCRGERVEPDCVSTRRYGALNQPID